MSLREIREALEGIPMKHNDYRDFIRTRSRPWVRIETTQKKPGHIVITSRGAVKIGSDQ